MNRRSGAASPVNGPADEAQEIARVTEFLLRSDRTILEYARELGLTANQACRALEKRLGKGRDAGQLRDLLKLELLCRDLQVLLAGVESRRHEVRLELLCELLGLPQPDRPARANSAPSAQPDR